MLMESSFPCLNIYGWSYALTVMGIVPVDKTCNEIVLAGGKALQDFIDEMDLAHTVRT